jgi:hypothetical protein
MTMADDTERRFDRRHATGAGPKGKPAGETARRIGAPWRMTGTMWSGLEEQGCSGQLDPLRRRIDIRRRTCAYRHTTARIDSISNLF